MALMQLATEEAQAASMRGRTIISEVVGESIESVSSSTEVESVHNEISYQRPEQDHQQYVVSSNLGSGIVTVANHQHHLLLPEYTQL